MKHSLGVLLLFVSLTTYANEWLQWPMSGVATLNWGPFKIYDSQLRLPEGHYAGPLADQALIITYRRNIDSDDLIDATREQWQALGVLSQEPQSEAWLALLRKLWPDVQDGSQLAFVLQNKQGQFWYRPAGSTAAFSPLGGPLSADLSRWFLAIWLDARTSYPELRQQLLGRAK
ncbi:hypothetical protein [Serratia sp. DD3]|uniref:hypothetical protein n=1 Tax=Serratia sp. DD3 TaxID=1410619 RepID=UPI0003C4F2CC|nr:hypothetical protein [Serratia sp. DD3]KEY59737.1 hypothetical protein SRDD_13140 [Serratia sp. DD3]